MLAKLLVTLPMKVAYCLPFSVNTRRPKIASTIATATKSFHFIFSLKIYWQNNNKYFYYQTYSGAHDLSIAIWWRHMVEHTVANHLGHILQFLSTHHGLPALVEA
jgi:hypothetical protein